MKIIGKFLLALWFVWSAWFTHVSNNIFGYKVNLFTDIVISTIAFNIAPWLVLYSRSRGNRKRALARISRSLPLALRPHLQFWRLVTISLVVIASLSGLYALSWTTQQFPKLREINDQKIASGFIPGELGTLVSWQQVTKSGSNPRTWHTCQRINVVVNSGGYSQAIRNVKSALLIINEMTGLNFVYAGESTLTPPVRRFPKEPFVLVAYYDESLSQRDFKFKDFIGRSYVGGDRDLSHGYIGLRLPVMSSFPPTLQSQILLHEFGHILGLAHTTTPGDLMAPIATGANLDFNASVRSYFKVNPGCAR